MHFGIVSGIVNVDTMATGSGIREFPHLLAVGALYLFPFDGAGGFGGDVVDDTVDACDFVDDPV